MAGIPSGKYMGITVVELLLVNNVGRFAVAKIAKTDEKQVGLSKYFLTAPTFILSYDVLPEVQTVGLGDKELVALLHSESLVPRVYMGQSAVDAPFTQ